MQKFKRHLVEQLQAEDARVWAIKKELQHGKLVMLLNVGKVQIAVIFIDCDVATIKVPGMGLEESAPLTELSRDAVSVLKEVESYLN